MKKLTWILAAVIIVLAILCATLWQRNTVEENDLKVMCKSSVNAALEHFEEYSTTGNEEEYIAGVAEFCAYMTTYLCLVNEASSAEYLWCNTLYGEMTLNPDAVKEHTAELVEALEYLAEDYQHPNGFNLINAINNKIDANETGSPSAEIKELRDGTLEFAITPNVDTIQMTVDTFKTNTTQIMVTTDDELGEDEVSVLLFSIKNGDEVFIGRSTLSEDENHNKIVFANLSSTSNYKIGVSARNLTQHITIKISEAKPAE